MVLTSAGGVAAGVTPADPCPEVFPVGSLTEGQALTGLTTDRGSTPTEFTATVLGVLDDGIAPDVDMILVDAHSSAIDKAGGIWSGMSGSPVYTDDGRLVGAVAYGLSWGSSSIAGVTPAAEMRRLHGDTGGVGGLTAATSVPLPAKLAARAVSRGAATAAEASSGLAPLATPLSVSGLSQRRLDQATPTLQRLFPRTVVYRAAAASAQAASAQPAPGAPVGAAVSYGDVTLSGIGTVTDVCGSTVVAFGHPMLFGGKVTYGAHPASAVLVQPDSLGAPFVVANLGLPPWGTVDQDRWTGIRATVGAIPRTVAVSSSLSGQDSGLARDGRTDVVDPDYLADASFYHLAGNLDRVLDKWGDGTTTFSWTAAGSHKGAPWSVSREERLGSSVDASYEAAGQVAALVQHLAGATGGTVTFDSISIDGDATETFDGATLKGIQVRLPSGAWVDVTDADEPVPAVAGARLHVRATFATKGGTTSVLPLAVAVQPASTGRTGVLSVAAGTRPIGCDPDVDEQCQPPAFDDALADVEGAPTGDTVDARLTEASGEEPDQPSGGAASLAGDDAPSLADPVRATADRVVTGDAQATVNVVAARSPRIGVVRSGAWSLRSSAGAGSATTTFRYGKSADRPVMGDWNGNGSATPGVFRDGVWYLRDSIKSGARPTVRYGKAGDLPVVGDWDGDGDDDLGVYRSGTFLLRTSSGTLTVPFGRAGDRPVAGDWDGDGVDTVGVFRSGTWYLRDANAAGPADTSVRYGKAGDQAVTGDWDRDGATDLGVYRAGTWYLRSSATGATSKNFRFGSATGTAVVWR